MGRVETIVPGAPGGSGTGVPSEPQCASWGDDGGVFQQVHWGRPSLGDHPTSLPHAGVPSVRATPPAHVSASFLTVGADSF